MHATRNHKHDPVQPTNIPKESNKQTNHRTSNQPKNYFLQQGHHVWRISPAITTHRLKWSSDKALNEHSKHAITFTTDYFYHYHYYYDYYLPNVSQQRAILRHLWNYGVNLVLGDQSQKDKPERFAGTIVLYYHNTRIKVLYDRNARMIVHTVRMLD